MFLQLLLISCLAGDEAVIRDGRSLPDPHTKYQFAAKTYSKLNTWKLRREELRRQILISSGLWPMPVRGKVSAQLLHSRRVADAIQVDTWRIETLPGFFVGANLYRPVRRHGRLPAVMIAHGHWKKGRIENTSVYSVPALASNLAAKGYIALAYDMIGYGDTKQIDHDFGVNATARAWAFHPLGLQLWNSLRIFDWLSQRRDTDPSRIAMTGASGGGTQTYLLAAVEERLRAAIPAVMLSLKFQGDDVCELAPGLRIGTNNIEIAALMAPRPMLLISTSQDWTANTPTQEFPALQSIYRLYGAANQLELLHQNAEHGFNAEARGAAYSFLAKALGSPDANAKSSVELELPSGSLESWLAGPSFALKEDENSVQAAWIQLLRERNARLSASQRVTLWRSWTGASWPSKVQRISTGEDDFLHRAGHNDLLRAAWQEGEGSTAILKVDAKALPKPEGQGVFLGLKVFSGAEAPHRSDYLVFHHPDPANRIQDLITGMAWLQGNGIQRIVLECAKGLEGECALAARISLVSVDYRPPPGASLQLNLPGELAHDWPH